MRTRGRRLRFVRAAVATAGIATLALATAPGAAASGDLLLASRPGGGEANGDSYHAAISGDGGSVAFQSSASNLAVGDRNGDYDIFVTDMDRGVTQLVSGHARGAGTGSGRSTWPAVSGDGRYVAFQSLAPDLVPFDPNGEADVFVRDMHTGKMLRIGGNGPSNDPAISASGRIVAFQSFASDLVPSDRNGRPDVFVRDMRTGTTTRLGGTDNPALSPDGRYVAFESGTGPDPAVSLHDRRTKRTRVVASGAYQPAVSASGRFVAFVRRRGAREDVYVRDMRRDVNRLVSVRLPGTRTGRTIYPSISADGRWVAFHSDDANLVPDDDNGEGDVFLRDVRRGVTRVVSRTGDGRPVANGYSGSPALAYDGTFVAFASVAANLVAGDANRSSDVFRRALR